MFIDIMYVQQIPIYIVLSFVFFFSEEDVDKEEVYKMATVLSEGDGLKVMLERY